MNVFKGRKEETGYFPYFNLNKKIIGPDDILVTNRALMEADEHIAFFEMDRKERIANLKNVRDTAFRSPSELKPCYDRSGNGVAPAAYEDPSSEELYDVFFDAETMELLPATVFQCPHVQLRFLGAPSAGKDVKSISALPALDVIQRYHEGLTYNVDYEPSSALQDVRDLYDRINDYYDGEVPEKTAPDAEVIPLPLRIDYNGKTILLEMVAEPGENLMNLQWKNQIFRNPFCITVFLMSANDYINLARGKSSSAINPSMQILKNYKKLGCRMGGLANEHHRFVFVLNQSDLLEELNKDPIREILSYPSMIRNKEGQLELLNEGRFDLDDFAEYEEKVWDAIKKTNVALYNELIEVKRYMEVTVLVTGDLNEETIDDKFSIDEYVPYRTDEFWLYMLYINGLIKGTTKNTSNERSIREFPLKDVMGRFNLLLDDDDSDEDDYEDIIEEEINEDEFEESKLIPKENIKEKMSKFNFARFLKGAV